MDTLKQIQDAITASGLTFKRTAKTLTVIAPKYSYHSAFLDNAFRLAESLGISHKAYNFNREDGPYTVVFRVKSIRTIDKIITQVSGKYGAPMGRVNVGTRPDDQKIYDCAVPMSGYGEYDKGGAYWGLGKQLRVSYTKDLSYIEFYRKGGQTF
jgi:hypothetical protein